MCSASSPLSHRLPFKAGFVNIASAAESYLRGKVPIIPAGLRYDEGKPWIGHIAFGEAIYRDKFSTKLELITFLERKVKIFPALRATRNLEPDIKIERHSVAA